MQILHSAIKMQIFCMSLISDFRDLNQIFYFFHIATGYCLLRVDGVFLIARLIFLYDAYTHYYVLIRLCVNNNSINIVLQEPITSKNPVLRGKYIIYTFSLEYIYMFF